MNIPEALKRRAHALKQETYALYLAARHPDTPWYAKVLVAGIVAYALSPIDLIPDFVPVLAECRARAYEVLESGRPVSRTAAAVIVAIWIVLAATVGAWLYQALVP